MRSNYVSNYVFYMQLLEKGNMTPYAAALWYVQSVWDQPQAVHLAWAMPCGTGLDDTLYILREFAIAIVMGPSAVAQFKRSHQSAIAFFKASSAPLSEDTKQMLANFVRKYQPPYEEEFHVSNS